MNAQRSKPSRPAPPRPRRKTTRRAARPRVSRALPRPKARRAARLGAAIPPWIRSLKDPCAVRDVRIPDGQMFPTATGSIRLLKSFTAPSATGKTFIGFCPVDFLVDATTGNSVSAFHYAVNSTSDSSSFADVASGSNNWPYNQTVVTTAPYTTLWPLMKSARVVSACARLTYTGSALVNGGLVTGVVLSQDQLAGASASTISPDGTDAAITLHSTPASVRNLPFNVCGPLRDGMEVFHYPTSKEELHFADREVVTTASAVLATNLSDYGSMGFLIDWSDAAQSVMIEYYVNFEYNPFSFATANTRTVPFEPSTISRVGSLASSIYNLVRPLVPHIIPVVRQAAQRYVQAGARSATPTIEEA